MKRFLLFALGWILGFYVIRNVLLARFLELVSLKLIFPWYIIEPLLLSLIFIITGYYRKTFQDFLYGCAVGIIFLDFLYIFMFILSWPFKIFFQ